MHTAEWRVRVWRIWSSVTYYMFLPCLNSHHFATEFYLLASLYMTVRVASHHHIPKPNLDCRAPTQGEPWLAEKLEWRRSWLAPGIPTQSVHFSGHLKGLSPIYKYIGVIRCTSRVSLSFGAKHDHRHCVFREQSCCKSKKHRNVWTKCEQSVAGTCGSSFQDKLQPSKW